MNAIVFPDPNLGLTDTRYATVMGQISGALRSRVKHLYVFGSAGTDQMTRDSDIDLILIADEVDAKFSHRALAYVDLLNFYPKLDMLVYTPAEFHRQMANADVGFWKSVRRSLRQIF